MADPADGDGRAEARWAPVTRDRRDAVAAGDVVGGRYRLVRPLGRGGFGVVWAADDTRGTAPVALKFVDPRQRSTMQWIRTELATLRHVRLPGVVRFVDDGPAGAVWFMVTEMVSGSHFPGGAPLADVTGRLLEILARLHWAGVVHRDLKEANVLVDAQGHPTVIDLGVARSEALDPLNRPCRVGTPGYWAPEQFDEGITDPRSDLYSVGVMITRALAESAEEASPALRALAARLTAERPSDRPQSAEEALRMLGHDLSHDVDRLAPTHDVDDPAALMPLFAGPEPILRRRSRMAAALWARTGGAARRVRAELGAWVRAGLCWVDGDALIVEAATVERLERGLPVVVGTLDPPLDDDAADLLVWARLAFPAASVDTLRDVIGWSPSRFATALGALRAAGVIWPLDAGGLGAAVVFEPAARWSEARRRDAHRRLAEVTPDGFRRVQHLVVGADRDVDFSALEATCRRALIDGHLAEVSPSLTLGLRLAREREEHEAERRLLELVTANALVQSRPSDREDALADVLAAERRCPRIAALEHLLRAALLASRGESQRALAELAQVSPFADPLLECWRVAAQVDATRRQRDEGPLLDALAAWAGGDTAREAMLLGWRGSYAYRHGRFAEAADLHAAASGDKPTVASRVASQVNEAAARLDALDPDGALRVARAVVAESSRLGLTRFEALGTWLLRTAEYRVGRVGTPRAELVDAAAAIDAETEALVAATEAAIAWRGGHAAVGLAARAAMCFERLRLRDEADLFTALAVAAGGASTAAQRAALTERARTSRAGYLAVQTLGLLARVEPSHERLALARALAEAARPSGEWAARLDVLSFAEALDPSAHGTFRS